MAGSANKLGLQYGWPGYIVPTDMLAAELVARKDQLKYEDRHPNAGDEDMGWRALLAERAARAAGTTAEAVTRRLYDVLNGKAWVIGTEMADAMLLAVGVMIEDHDLNLPVLPGCTSAAQDMAEVWGEELTPDEQKQLGRSLMNFSIGFLYGDRWLDECLPAAEAVGEFLVRFGQAPEPELYEVLAPAAQLDRDGERELMAA